MWGLTLSKPLHRGSLDFIEQTRPRPVASTLPQVSSTYERLLTCHVRVFSSLVWMLCIKQDCLFHQPQPVHS